MTLDSLFSFFARYVRNIRAFITARPRISVVIGALLLIILWMLFAPNGKDAMRTLVVTQRPFVQQVSVSGKVKASEEVQMAFEQTGRVDKIYVSVGDTVALGDPLVSISSGTLFAQLQSAQAQATLKRVERENSMENLEEVRRQQETNVATAYRTLLSDDLEATPFSSSYTVSAPIITGAYLGSDEGTYKLNIERQHSGATSVQMRVFGLETYGPTTVSKTGPTPIGTRGLYISFPDDSMMYDDTIWYVNLPNTKSASYVSNLNTYQEARKTRDKAILDAQASLERYSGGLTIKDAELASAEAEVARILAELSKFSLKAPFDGVITSIDAEVGEAASVQDNAVSLISDDTLEVESFVPEINIAYLEVGDTATITLDAYGEYVPFPATVVAIDPAETVRDGVSTYRVRLAFTLPDERVRSGMTANIVITTDERPAVLAVPQGIIERKDGASFVPVLENGKRTLRQVTTGLVSSLGEIEILSGLSEGETVLLPSM